MNDIAITRRQTAVGFVLAAAMHAVVLLTVRWQKPPSVRRLLRVELSSAVLGPEATAPSLQAREQRSVEKAPRPAENTTAPVRPEPVRRDRAGTRAAPDAGSAGVRAATLPAERPARPETRASPGEPALAASQPPGAPVISAQLRARYEQVLAAWIDRYKVYPEMARRRRLQGRGLLRVRITRDGTLVSEELDRSTSHGVLDRAARDTVRRAAPFPPVPEELPGRRYEFVVPFVFELAGR